MKKYLFILLLFLSFSLTAQVKIIRVADATTAIGENISQGTQVFNRATNKLWIAKNAVISTATLTTASASFDPSDTILNIATTVEINTGSINNKAISPLGFAGSDYASDIAANNSKVTFPGFTSLLSDYGFTDDTGGDAYLGNTQSFTGVNSFNPTGSNKLKVSGNDWFTIGDVSGYGRLLWFANYDGTTSNLFARHATIVPVEITHAIEGIEVNTYVNNGDDTLVGAKTTVLEATTSNLNYLGNKVDVLPSNKTWVLYGDSMINSLSGDWIGVTLDSLGVPDVNVTINAVAGDKIVDQLTDLDADLAGDANYLDDFDVILLNVGVNDFANSSVLGDISDTAASSTVIGYFKDFIETVYTANPEIKFYITTPLQYTNATFGYNGSNYDGWTLAQLANAIAKICAEYSVSCIDLYNTSGFNSVTDDTLSDDATPLHPNALGKVVVGNEAYRAIKGGTPFANMYPYDDVFRAPLKTAQGKNSTATKLELENYDVSLLQDEFVGRIDFITNDSNSGNGVAGSITSVLEDAGFWYGLGFNVKSSGSEYEAMRVSYNGVISAPGMTTAEITAKGNTALITKEYFDTYNTVGAAEVYGSGWDSDTSAPQKNDVYDKIESLNFGAYIADSDMYAKYYAARVLLNDGEYESLDHLYYDLESVLKESIQFTPNAVKADSIYALNVKDPKTSNAADFGFTRSTTATRININGILETVAADTPRIDYTTGVGTLLLEGASTNKALRSNEFDNASWTKTRATATASSAISIDGTINAYKFYEDNTAGTHEIKQYISGLTNSVSHTFSVFAKADERYKMRLNIFGGYAEFNLSDGTIITQPTVDDASIESYGDGWYRIAITKTANNTVTNAYAYILNDAGSVSYTGDNVSGVLLYGAQLEETDFATSYIPTTTATVTRNAETASGSGSTALINSQEGVLYMEASALFDDTTSQRVISVSDGTASNQIILGYDAFSNRIIASLFDGGLENVKLSYVITDVTALNKIAFKWAETDFALWINGTEVATNSTSSVDAANTYNELQLAEGDGTNDFIGRIRELKVFTTALTDAELTTLTSKDDYSPKHLARTDVDPYFTKDVTVQRNLNVEGTITSAPSFLSEGGATHTLTSALGGYTINYTSGSAKTITIPTNATDAIAVGTTYIIVNTGSADLTFSTTGITLNDDLTNQTLVQYAKRTLIKTDTNTWLLAY